MATWNGPKDFTIELPAACSSIDHIVLAGHHFTVKYATNLNQGFVALRVVLTEVL